MSGFIGLNELFRKLELGLNVRLGSADRAHIKRLLYPLSLKNKFTLCLKDFESTLEELCIQERDKQEEVRDFLIDYLAKNIQDML